MCRPSEAAAVLCLAGPEPYYRDPSPTCDGRLRRPLSAMACVVARASGRRGPLRSHVTTTSRDVRLHGVSYLYMEILSRHT